MKTHDHRNIPTLTDGRPHWYHITYEECPVCGKEVITRERRYTPKPERDADRYEHKYLNHPCPEFL